MSIGRILKQKLSGVETLENLIDKELKNRPKFSMERLIETAKDLSSYVEDGDVDVDVLNKKFFALHEAFYADKPRRKGVISPSSLRNECERKYYYYFTGAEETDEVVRDIDGRTQRIFDVGTWWHTYIQTALWKAGVLEKSEVRVRNRKTKVYGSTDGKIHFNKERMILEIKTMNSFTFAKGKHGVLDDHKYQATIYAKESDIHKICFIYLNKDTSEIKVHYHNVEEKTKKLIDNKINFIHNSVKNKKAPERVCESRKDKRACECAFRKLCFNIK